MTTSWNDHLYRQPLSARQKRVSDHFQLSAEEQQQIASHATALGDQMVENYLTSYDLPEGLCVGLVVNGHEYTVPMVTEEPSVIAAACNGAGRVARSGGFTAPRQSRLLTGQVVVNSDTGPGRQWLNDHQTDLVKVANEAHPSLKKRGAGAKSVLIRQCGRFISCDLQVDVSQAMGANSVNTMAEACGHYLTAHGFSVVTAILSNLATGTVQTATCEVALAQLATATMPGDLVASRIAELSDLAQADPSRAATNNKGVMNGIDAVVIATGNDWRATESGAHAWAARQGQYRGLTTWQVVDGHLHGQISLPLDLGVVGGSIGLHWLTKLNRRLLPVKDAQELAAVTASLGLAQNLAALRALVTTGIQAGHMKLQYRSLAIAVGAKASEVSRLVKCLTKLPRVDREIAAAELARLRKE